MINGKRIAVVMPAYNAEKTLEKTVGNCPTLWTSRFLSTTQARTRPRASPGSSACRLLSTTPTTATGATSRPAIARLWPRAQTSWSWFIPITSTRRLLVPAMAGMVASGVYDMVLASRILGAGALKGGMPFYKYVANRLLTAFQNLFLGVKLSEYHTGFRAFSRELLETLPLLENSDDFVFDNQMIAQAVMFGFKIGEISCPTKYFEEASSINFKRSVKYGFGVLATTFSFVANKMGIVRVARFGASGRKVTQQYYSHVAQGS